MSRISSKGEAESTVVGRASVIKIFNHFSKVDEELAGVEWHSLPEEVLCSPGVYERFAHYMLFMYVIAEGNKNAGDPLKGGTPKQCTSAG